MSEEKKKGIMGFKKKKFNMLNPLIDTSKNLDMCFLLDETFAVKDKSSVASMVESNSEIATTKMEIPLKSGVPIKDVNDKGDGNSKCIVLC